MKEVQVTNVLPDGQLWVREVLDDGTVHRRVVEPGALLTKEPREEVKAVMREVHTTAVNDAFKAAREASLRPEVAHARSRADRRRTRA